MTATDNPLPGRTDWESSQYLKDHGHRVAAAQAYRYIGRLIETDPAFPLPDDSEAVIALAAAAMKDIHTRRSASAEAYAAEGLARIHAAVAEMYPRSAA